jgi:hypothetical protein
MSNTSIGDLSVGVTLNTDKLDAGFREMSRKVKAQAKQLDKEYAAMAGGKSFGYGGGFGTGYGGASRRGAGRGRNAGGNFSLGGDGGGGLGGVLARQALGRITGMGEGLTGNLLRSAGPVAGAVGFAGAAFGAVNFARNASLETKRMDESALAAKRWAESLGELGFSLKVVREKTADFAVSLAGDFARFSEFAGSGFSWDDSRAFDAAARGAAQQQSRRDAMAKAQGFDSWADYSKAVSAQRERILDFTRNDRFSQTDDQGRARILAKEIETLAAKEKQARAEKRILDAETMRLDRLAKIAELRDVEAKISQRALDFENQTRMQAAARMDDDDAQREAEKRKAAEDEGARFYAKAVLDSQNKLALENTFAEPAPDWMRNIGASSLGGAAGDARSISLLSDTAAQMTSLIRSLLAEQQRANYNLALLIEQQAFQR